ncbi:DEAD/DEAH box helicase family protein [Halarcobacter sp.]|uniref:type III restriction-modification system endonuclease n=1 Tax=Halarcobacter sp. TaxID=2321133 RepID=UPI0029F5C6F1|nr:DEAD/DEAH box helicase family protein [Halarcobacter sp.]
MNIRFKKQQYQENAVNSVVDCFRGQKKVDGISYRVDPGKIKTVAHGEQSNIDFEEELSGFKNSDFTITPIQIFENIHKVQREQNLPVSDKLITNSVCDINLDVEMETGTGKTFCYTKTCFELNKQYGWNKFIIVVPSIAIREGVQQSIELTREYFKEEYGKQVKSFIYNSKELHNIEDYSSDAGINIMIINVQAFNATGADNRRIYDELDSFNSRRPIDVIKANRPILIIDEPQKIEGDAKKESKSFKSLKEFNPLFILRYSATFKKEYNKIHRLDALDAYNQKLVKKISVRGITVKGLSGTNAYLYLEGIEISSSKPPIARLEFELRTNSGIKTVTRKIEVGDDLEVKSEGLSQYRDFVVSEIDAYKNKIYFKNGIELSVGEASGDVNEESIRRIQIRETIKAHLQKEQMLYSRGIKVLSLFFIDEVAKYRIYDNEDESNGEYARIFEEEYEEAVKNIGLIYDKDYEEYLKGIGAYETHNGYFAQDKHKKMIDPKVSARGENAGLADDVDAYDLILKDKKRLLSFKEKTRFIFSHSALREGWDNPNVFVICTLKHSDNTISRRQEVGRGMRICVNQHGERMDNPATVHKTNILTVIANESYKDFVTGLQKDISETLTTRPKVADADFFSGKTIIVGEEKIKVDDKMAKQIYKYLVKNDYVDDEDMISKDYHDAKDEETLAKLPEELEEYKEQVFQLIDSLFSKNALDGMVEDETKDNTNPINEKNFKKKEFQELWNKINQKAVYTVDFDSSELVKNAKNAINKELHVKALEYTVVGGTQTDNIAYESLKSGAGFKEEEKETVSETRSVQSKVRYDLIGKVAENTKLTRKTVGEIFKLIEPDKFRLYRVNPEEFISQSSRIINEQKAAMVVNKLTYSPIDQKFDSDIFFAESEKQNFSKAKKVDKHIYDYIVTDSKNEIDFVNELDTNKEVVVYAKLPRGFFIPTPVGNYNPDWAISFEEGSVKYIYFVAETKGSMSSLQTRKIEEIKIDCAREFFKKISTDKVKYDKVDNYDTLMKIVNGN